MPPPVHDGMDPLRAHATSATPSTGIATTTAAAPLSASTTSPTSPTYPGGSTSSPSGTTAHKRKRADSSISLSSPRAGAAAAETAHDLALYGDLRASKRPKFIVVDDVARSSRIRVRATLDQVEMNEIPDSFRRQTAVFPRAYFPTQMADAPGEARRRGGGRWLDEPEGVDPEAAEVVVGPRRAVAARPDALEPAFDGPGERSVAGRTLVRVRDLEAGADADAAKGELVVGGAADADADADAGILLPVPGLTSAKRRRESMINELGYRMSWSQGRVFAGRVLFLQRSRMFFLAFSCSHALFLILQLSCSFSLAILSPAR